MQHLAKRDDSCIVTSNKYMLLNNVNDSRRPKLSDALRKAVENRKSAGVKVKHKAVVIGDSRIKRCSEKISNLLDASYNVTGITKPNANLEALNSPIAMNVDGYTKDDVLILSGGTIDVARNETKNGLRHLINFLKRTFSTNVVIILDIPRFDLVNSSCEQRNHCV